MYDWDNARIPIDWYYPSFGEGQILQNQDYIFYPEDGNKIVRISKSDGSKEIICEFDFIEDKFIHYCLSEDGMFVEYNSNIYSCGFDGENIRKIISRKKLKKQMTAIKNNKFIGNIATLYFYKGNLYMVSYYRVWKLDLTTKKITKMLKNTFWGGCFCAVNANGYFDSENSEEAHYEKRKAMNAQRLEDYKSDAYALGGGVADPMPEDAPWYFQDYHAYYKTERGYHPRSLNSNGGWNVIGCQSFMNMPILQYSNEIRSAVMVLHGDKAHSCYFGKDAYAAMIDGNKYQDNKALLLVPGASHTDLYDQTDIIPFDRLEEFFNKNLK